MVCTYIIFEVILIRFNIILGTPTIGQLNINNTDRG